MRRALLIAVSAACGTLLLAASPAYAAAPHLTVVAGGILGDIFGSIGHAVLGAFSWTFSLASKFFLITVGALVKLLIPRSWARDGVQLMNWIVQVPNYAGTINTPTGQVYGFRGINELRDLFTWIGIAVGPFTLILATSRAMVSEREHPALPLARLIGLAVLLISYPYWWQQAAALIDQITHTILSLPAVSDGIHKLMLYAVDGVALGGWQLIDLAMMLAIGLALLALLFLKVVIILLGALLYAIGPLMIGLVPLESGAAISRGWASAAAALLALPVLWAAVFAVGALLIDDAGTAGPLLAGNTTIGHLVGGLLLAVAGLAALWACLRLAKEAGSLLRLQLGGMLAGLHNIRSAQSSTVTGARSSAAARSLREFGQRVSRATGATGQALAATGPRGARLARASGLAITAGRRGLVGSAALAGAAGARQLFGYTGGPRAGVVATQIARAGRSYKTVDSVPANGARQRRAAAATAGATSAPAPARGTNSSALGRSQPAPAPASRVAPVPGAAPAPGSPGRGNTRPTPAPGVSGRPPAARPPAPRKGSSRPRPGRRS